MDKYIRVKNCNCISDATIEIVEKSLNIKYGSNGTGKSTISEAIYAQANNETDRLKDFKPYSFLLHIIRKRPKRARTTRMENLIMRMLSRII